MVDGPPAVALVDAAVQALLAHEAFDAQVPGPARRRWNCSCGGEGFEDGPRPLNPWSSELVDRTRAAGRRHVATAVVADMLAACDVVVEYGVRVVRDDGAVVADGWDYIDRTEAEEVVAYINDLSDRQASAQLICRSRFTGPVEVAQSEATGIDRS